MDFTIEDARVVVDYEGTDYAFEVVGDNELTYADTSAPEAAVPDEVLEELEARGYIVHPE
ncbi:hypothetical protein [Natrinema salifodinae]|uniref:Uncharacterized protein n=1 Tax=Natrinema salifodinae TaxID=1202768 RepID=A0A1I0NJN8_9EURY|nr:hypothetical protein [Natrinema salifodinae]SEW01383.1 hypothetical protein SAMN05216285_1786 [Natrinema salifodinae]